MRKLKFYIAALAIALCCVCFGQQTVTADAAGGKYYLGGMTAGFMLGAGGAQVIDLSEVNAEEGARRPAEEAGLKAGDCICAVDGIAVKTIKDLNDALARCGGKEVVLTVKRAGENAEVRVLPAKEKKSGKYKIGVLIRDTLSGIGTVTYIDRESGRFGALGHKVADEGNNMLEISDNKVYLCSIVGVNKGARGRAGELRGLFLNDKPIAYAEKVCSTGLYGKFEAYDFSHCASIDIAPLAEATIGKATIYSTVDGTYPQAYDIAIAKVDEGSYRA